jgi:sn1-specific diacylglycerol lipase
VCGKEWIPRLSLKTFGRMRDEMVFAALRCKRPKWLVFWHLMRGKRFEEEELFYAPDELPMEAREALAAYQQSVERNPTIRSFLEIAGDFGPPGRCFHLKPTGRTSHTASRRGPFNLRHGKQRRYRAVWIDGHAIIDEGVLISGRMMAGVWLNCMKGGPLAGLDACII